MNKKKLSRQEIRKLMTDKAIEGRISIEDLSEIVYDNRLPEVLFEPLNTELIKGRDDLKRFLELYDVVAEKLNRMSLIQKEILKLSEKKLKNKKKIRSLKAEIAQLEKEVSPMEKELSDIKSRIDEREGRYY